ncbi:hypothetical protein BP5796_08597 [Coleophoma crateriformis]|uniref:Uncharacterized protein n=1 Tax=Coleophoma crateriformis TaxID=565419 RepID=A0A3D8R8C8_9HELO|nr:hypothetical protein BP5796_08597 [Coleophoma crateriformis]
MFPTPSLVRPLLRTVFKPCTTSHSLRSAAGRIPFCTKAAARQGLFRRAVSSFIPSTTSSVSLRQPAFTRSLPRAYSTSPPPLDNDLSNKPAKRPLLKALTKVTKHENIYTIPNILTFSRLIAAPVVGYLVLHDQHAWAVGLFAYAGITDLVDGWIARRWNLQTVVGTVIDPMADKTLMTILTVCLAIKGALPVWLAFIILGRDVGLAIAAIYYRWISLPPPKTFSRYWDFSLPSAEVHPTTISKYNTALQLALIGATTAMPLITADISTAMMAMQYLVATTTVWSGASYVYTKDAVKILSQEKKPGPSKAQDTEAK